MLINGKLKNISETNSDSLLYDPQYTQLYEAFLYVQHEKGKDFVQKKYGTNLLPEPQERYKDSAYDFVSLPLLDGKTKKIDISMYRSLYPINLSDSCEDISVDTSGKKLLIKDKNDVLLNISFEELQTSLLQKSGLTKNSTKKRFLQQENILTNYETDSLYISFGRIIFDMKTDLTISNLQIDYILRK